MLNICHPAFRKRKVQLHHWLHDDEKLNLLRTEVSAKEVVEKSNTWATDVT